MWLRFQWAVLQLEQLHRIGPREDDIRRYLGKLPAKLHELYDEIYTDIQSQEGSAPEVAERAFHWVMCSQMPLTPAVLLGAVCQDPDIDFAAPVDIDMEIVLDACRNLLAVDASGHCRFSHPSVHEYLETRWQDNYAHGQVAKVCLRLLLDPAYRVPEVKTKHAQEKSPRKVVDYATLYWPVHVSNHGEEAIDQRLAFLLKSFLGSPRESSAAYVSWCDQFTGRRSRLDWATQRRHEVLLGFEAELAPSTRSSFAICYFGFHKILCSWWKAGFRDVEERNDRGHSLMQLAALGGSIVVVECLLDFGADINARGKKTGTVLQSAVFGGSEAIVKLLLDSEADVNAQNYRGETALQIAASRGSEAIVELLFIYGADINAYKEQYGDALLGASSGGHDKIVKLLLSKHANVNIQERFYSNLLQGVLSKSHRTTTKLLPSKNTDIDTHENALLVASRQGHYKIVELLLSHGADVNAQGGPYGNALQAASYKGHKTTVKLLLSHGADVNAQGGPYGNALQAASYKGHKTTVKLLLSPGADVNAQGGLYGNALQTASYDGHETTVKLLLSHGADVNAQGGLHGNALQAASYDGHETTVKLLLSHGADVNAQGGHFGNALQAASYNGHETTVKLLLSHGADVNAQGGLYGNALEAASRNGHRTTVELLLSKGADVNTLARPVRNVLKAPSIPGPEKAVEPLLAAGQADLDSRESDRQTPLPQVTSSIHDQDQGRYSEAKTLVTREPSEPLIEGPESREDECPMNSGLPTCLRRLYQAVLSFISQSRVWLCTAIRPTPLPGHQRISWICVSVLTTVAATILVLGTNTYRYCLGLRQVYVR